MFKRELGQFYTTNYAYILDGMNIPENITTIIEPFVGNGDLLKFIKDDKYNIELYDIDPKIDNVIEKDTILDPPDYKGKFVLTNPPYIARNKNKNKQLYDKYNCNDLYKCFISILLDDVCDGGLIIVPLNFLSSIRKSDIELRKKFVTIYDITRVNIFEERVFVDTSYTVCSILFSKRVYNTLESSTNFTIYPSMRTMNITICENNNYTIGGEIYSLPQNKIYKIKRATKNTSTDYITNILLKCIDDNINNKLGFKIVDDKERYNYIDRTLNLTARSYAILIINKKMTIKEQEILVSKMNVFITQMREKYNSLFLTNFRESNSIARKRISFSLAFKICNYILGSS